MANNIAEAVIGAAVVLTAAIFLVYAGEAGGYRLRDDSYALSASFRSAQGISVGTDVRVAGIKVGSVTALDLDNSTFQAKATFSVQDNLKIPDDSDVKIASEGLLGGSFLEITPGASETSFSPGDQITNTQGSIDLLNLLMRFGTGK